MKKIFLNLFKFLDHPHHSEQWGGGCSWEHTGDFLFLPEIHSARKHIYLETVSLVFVSLTTLFILLEVLKFFTGYSIFVFLSSFFVVLYFILLVFKLWVVSQAITFPLIDFTSEEIQAIKDEELPVYTILIPLYREEKVIRQILTAMTAIDYPPEKLDVIITLEAYDYHTINAIREIGLPKHFHALILPDVHPKTKPKALNVAFLKTRGKFLVIYDAEIIPEPDQLKKAYLAFKKFPEIGCFQTRLDHYNAHQNFLTKLFNAEFSFYYDLFLPGLQKLGYPIPLSGHSVHFRKEILERIGAWDPYNVAEDCDIGIRIHRMGYRTGIINSTSLEEATSGIKSWIMQRTRWMKGFIQTSIVHLRHPFRFKDEIGGWRNFFAFLLTIPGTVIINVLNLFYWILLILWITTHSVMIQKLFPGFILYVSVSSFVIGNILFTYLNLLGSYKRKRYALVRYALLSPFYWVLLAIATTRSTIQIITNPHHWEKTTHGENLSGEKHSARLIPSSEDHISNFRIEKMMPSPVEDSIRIRSMRNISHIIS